MPKYKYQNLYEDLLGKIRDGVLLCGEKIPSQRQLMEEYDLSYSTVMAALKRLQRENIIDRRQGSGSFVLDLSGARFDQQAGVILAIMSPNIPAGTPSGMTKGIYDASLREGVQLEFVIFSGEKDRREKCRQIISGDIRASGVLVPYLPGYDDVVEMLGKAAVPCLVMQAPVAYPGVTQLIQDHVRGARLAVEHLIKHGHREIAIFAGEQDDADRWMSAKVEGYRRALRENGITFDENLLQRVEDTVGGSLEEMKKFLRRGEFSAIFSTTGRIGENLVNCLAEFEIAVPQEMALVSFDVVSQEALVEGDVSGMHISHEEIGEAGVRFLASIVNEPQSSVPPPCEVPIHFVRRTSCGCA